MSGTLLFDQMSSDGVASGRRRNSHRRYRRDDRRYTNATATNSRTPTATTKSTTKRADADRADSKTSRSAACQAANTGSASNTDPTAPTLERQPIHRAQRTPRPRDRPTSLFNIPRTASQPSTCSHQPPAHATPQCQLGCKTHSAAWNQVWVPHSSRHRTTHRLAVQASGDAKGGGLYVLAYTIRPPPFAYGEEWGTRRYCHAPCQLAQLATSNPRRGAIP